MQSQKCKYSCNKDIGISQKPRAWVEMFGSFDWLNCHQLKCIVLLKYKIWIQKKNPQIIQICIINVI